MIGSREFNFEGLLKPQVFGIFRRGLGCWGSKAWGLEVSGHALPASNVRVSLTRCDCAGSDQVIRMLRKTLSVEKL